MKLISCYISSFGKLKDFSYSFDSGLNTINHENGWGKSTFATFIKCMFYGINSGKRSISENERIKFKPWNSTERFGGNIIFEWGKKEYKIERYFGNKDSEDTVRLFDVASGKEYQNTENLGKRIFEIDEEGFLSTTYFSQKDFQIKSNTSLTEKFNSVCEIDDGQDFDKAIKRLDEKAKTYKYRGDKGLISDLKREMITVDENVEQCLRAGETAKILKEDVLKLENQALNLKERSNKLTEQVAKAGQAEAIRIKKTQYLKLVDKSKQLENAIGQTKSVLGNLQPDVREVEAYKTCNNDLIQAKARITALKEDINSLENANIPVKKENVNNFIFLITAIILAVVGIVMFCIDIIVAGVILGVLAILCGVLHLVLSKKAAKNGKVETGYQALLDKKRVDLENYLNIEREYESRIDGFIGKFNVGQINDRASALNMISDSVSEQVKLIAEIKEVEKAIADFDQDLPSFERDNSQTFDVISLKNDLREVQIEYAKISDQLSQKRASLDRQIEISNKIVDWEAVKQQYSEKLISYQEEYDLLLKTMEYLTRANENLKIKYRKPLEESLNKYLEKINGKKVNALIDVDLNILVQESGGDKSTEYYSKGYRNLFEICKRFALTDVLFKGEKPFIILDDPFYNLDETKIKESLDLIKTLSQEYQIIYFVCHQSRAL